ncbi:putative fungistatic metabolite [Lachnellula suecica]|uniref:Putative fungistatic metabolite n=1 Tax=Lachnellula suecica TaxID=602035 RepID=A0A8T9BTH6_9HELO|nr:putative fungistatic metabolite [Lachnellula suecica]
MANSLLPMRVFALIACLFVAAVLAQSSTSSAAAATSSATIYPDTSKWQYVGCQNETTLLNNTNGLRALNGGTSETLNTMTVDICLNYCASSGNTYAGLEYTNECFCAQRLSALSTKLPESSCNLACTGNSSQICGGSLALTVYTAKTTTQGAGNKVQQAPMSSVLALGIALGVLLCLA